MQIKKRCNKAGCRKLIDVSESYCDKHKSDGYRRYNKARYRNDREYVSFYSCKEWRDLRYQALLRDGFECQYCKEKGLIKQAEMVDHVKPTRERWDLRLDIDNLKSSCWSCHNKKTAEDLKRLK